MGAIAVYYLPNGEAQTAAGVRGRAFLPKTARRAPQALEAGAFWVHWPKCLSIRSLAVLLRRVLAVFKVPPADLIPCGGSGGALLVVLLLRFVVGEGAFWVDRPKRFAAGWSY